MTHSRTLVRDGLAAALAGTPGIVGVHRSRVWPSRPEALPALCVYVPTEELRTEGGRRPGQRIVRRSMAARIVAVFARPMAPENTLETDIYVVIAAVEARLASDPTLAQSAGLPVCSNLRVTRIDMPAACTCAAASIATSVRTAHLSIPPSAVDRQPLVF